MYLLLSKSVLILEESLLFLSQKVNFTSTANLLRCISQVFTSKRYLLARRQQPVKEFKRVSVYVCVCVCRRGR